MKKAVFLMSMLMATGLTSLNAQQASSTEKTTSPKPQKSPQEKAEQQAKQLGKDLKLSKEQIAEVRVAALERITNMLEARAMGEDKNNTRGRKINAIQLAWDAKIQKILTPEQYTKYAQRKEQIQKGRRAQLKTGVITDNASEVYDDSQLGLYHTKH